MIIRVCHIHFYGIILEFTLYHQEQTALSPSTRTGNVTPISSLARMLLSIALRAYVFRTDKGWSH